MTQTDSNCVHYLSIGKKFLVKSFPWARISGVFPTLGQTSLMLSVRLDDAALRWSKSSKWAIFVNNHFPYKLHLGILVVITKIIKSSFFKKKPVASFFPCKYLTCFPWIVRRPLNPPLRTWKLGYVLSTSLPIYSDTIGTRKKCHCKQVSL